MKKFLTLLLALTIVFALACPVFADAENFAADAKWDKGTSGGVTTKDGVATVTGFVAKYSCASIDILPAMKAAVGEEDEVEVAVIFEARVNFKADSSEESTEAMMLLRGANGISGLGGKENMDAWLEAYDESLDGEDRFFTNSSGNILKYCSDTIEITNEWQTFATTLVATNGQINNPSVIKWNLTLDRFTTFADFESLEFRNLQVVLAEDAEGIIPEEKEEKPTEKPAENPADKPATEATSKPAVQTPGADAATPSQNEGNENNNVNITFNPTVVLISAGVCCAIIIAACIVAVIVVKKKTSK